jgi:hypothetical protein
MHYMKQNLKESLMSYSLDHSQSHFRIQIHIKPLFYTYDDDFRTPAVTTIEGELLPASRNKF